ncbi:hypothetical protein LY76DRAFT_212710 [Colletotrichum caudatum]|nr:hypothetical protein LY76DRAFT_212710 [Colletotrichum caudatum]
MQRQIIMEERNLRDQAAAAAGQQQQQQQLEQNAIQAGNAVPVWQQPNQPGIHTQIGNLEYRCKCGRKVKPDRKWEHKRHVKNCRMTDDPGRAFSCRCGKKLVDLLAHLDHIKNCGKLPARRRPQSATSLLSPIPPTSGAVGSSE